MSDYIKREDARRAIAELRGGCITEQVKDFVDYQILSVPSADVVEVRHGEWKSVKASIYPYGYDVECSVCGHKMGSSFGYKYCPNCGAKMEGCMAEYVDEKYAKEVLEVKDSFGGFDSLIPPKDDEIYINNKGAVLMSMNTLMGIWKHPEMKDRVFEKLEEMFLADYAIEKCPSNDKEQEHER